MVSQSLVISLISEKSNRLLKLFEIFSLPSADFFSENTLIHSNVPKILTFLTARKEKP